MLEQERLLLPIRMPPVKFSAFDG